MKTDIQTIYENWNAAGDFSGVFSVSGPNGLLYEQAAGKRNRAEALPNQTDTAFAIASGTKFLTALAACKLIDTGGLSLDTPIRDVITHDLNRIDLSITIRHLLTHTSGIGDYIDEEADSEYDPILLLYKNHPVHEWTSLAYYLPMMTGLPAKFAPGARFGYSNGGFILLGLAIEGAAGMPYHAYVQREIIEPLGLCRTGFYRMNRLPGNTAMGYVFQQEDGVYETNVLYMPVIGGADGGLFTTAGDLVRLWTAVMENRVLSPVMTRALLTPQVLMHEEDGSQFHYGLGVYMRTAGEKKAYYIVGGDFGVDFFSAYYPGSGFIASALGNTEKNTGPLLRSLFDVLA